jgi:hypothetical protein
MHIEGPLLYRGTTPGWPGSRGLQAAGVTPMTTDPLVATLFALECLRHGPAIIQFCERAAVAGLLQPGNVLADLEREVVISVSPAEFTDRFECGIIDVHVAREILSELGYELPPTVADKWDLHNLLKSTPRLRDSDVREFDRRAGERG